MSWTQVYVTGLARAINPSDEEIEAYLCKRYSLTDAANSNSIGDDIAATINNDNLMWAGEGSTLIKRDDSGCCRGFAFLTFYSVDGAMIVIDRINNDVSSTSESGDDCISLRAELSNPKGGGTKKKSNKKNNEDNLPDLRLRRQRKQPVRKHPVVTSSDGKRTNLGNKTK